MSFLLFSGSQQVLHPLSAELLWCVALWVVHKLGNQQKCWCTSQSEFSVSRRDGYKQKSWNISTMSLLSTEVTVASIIHVNCVHLQMVNNSLEKEVWTEQKPLVIRKRWGATRSARLTVWEDYSAVLCIQKTSFHKTKFKHTDNIILLLFTFFRKLAELILCAVIESCHLKWTYPFLSDFHIPVSREIKLVSLFFFFLAMPCNMQNLSSPTKDSKPVQNFKPLDQWG